VLPAREFILDTLASILIGVVVGVIVGTYGVVFESLGELVELVCVPHFRAILGFIGFTVTGYALYKVTGGFRGSSTDYFVEVYNFMYGKLNSRYVLVYAAFALLTVVGGGSVGPGGPALIMGGFIAYLLARKLRRTPLEDRYFTLIGGAAGISAVFRAPLTALSFGIEVPYRMDGIFVETLVACLIAYLVAVSIRGPQPLLLLGGKVKLIPSLNDIVIGIVAGIASAILSMLMIWVKQISKHFSHIIVERLGRKSVIVAGVVGATLSFAGVFLPGASGAGTLEVKKLVETLKGYEHIERNPVDYVFSSTFKTISTPLSLMLGGTGGIFSPMVAIGVMFGYGLSFLIGLKDLSDIEALMAAMVAGLFAGTNKVVVSAILFSLEVVGFGGLVPSALAASIAYLLTINAGLIDSQLSYRSSAKVAALLEIYERLKEERSLILEIPAEKVANKQVVTLYYRMTIADALKEIEDNLHIAYPVVDDHNRLIGYVEVEDLLAMEPNNRVYETLRPAPTTLPNTPLSTIIEYFARYGLERLFIIDYDGKLIGIVSKTDLLKLLLKAYTKEIVEGSVRGPPLHRKSASD